MTPQSGHTRSQGRPRAFDREIALDAAMHVFWRHGYEGASLAQLTRAMGINRPSLYASFGDKAALFRHALDHYQAQASGYISRALNASTALETAEQLLLGAIDFTTQPGAPRGCLLLNGALVSGDGSAPIVTELRTRRDRAERALARRFRRARSHGDLPPGSRPAALARYLVTLIRGLGVQAANGSSRTALRRTARTALRGWPFSDPHQFVQFRR